MSHEHTKLDAFAWSKQGNALGLSFASPPVFTADGAGDVGGTTIVASDLTATFATDDEAVGYLVMVMRCANGPSGERGAPIMARVLAYDSVTGTLTVEKLPWQTSSGDTFALLIPPHGWWSDDTGGSAVQVQDADRGEADDFWIGAAEKGGPYTEVLHADNIGAGLQAIPADFAQLNGVLTVALGANTALGDLIELLEWPEVMGGPLSVKIGRLERESVIGTHGKLRSVSAPVGVSGSLEQMFRGPGSSRAGEPAELDTPLGAVTTATDAPGDCTVDAGSAVDDIITDVGAPAVGEMYISAEGYVFMVEAVTSGVTEDITPSPDLGMAPVEDTTLCGLRVYTPAEALPYALFLRQWFGRGLLADAWGVAGNPVFTAERGSLLKVAWALQGTDGYVRHLDSAGSAYARTNLAKLPTVTPRQVGVCRVVLDGIVLEAKGWTLDLGLDLQPRSNLAAPNGLDGIDLRGDAPSGTVDLWLDTGDSDGKQMLRRFQEGRGCTMLLQAGTLVGEPGVLAFWAHEVEIATVEPGDDAGGRTVQLQWRATHDPARTSGLPRWAIGIG